MEEFGRVLAYWAKELGGSRIEDGNEFKRENRNTNSKSVSDVCSSSEAIPLSVQSKADDLPSVSSNTMDIEEAAAQIVSQTSPTKSSATMTKTENNNKKHNEEWDIDNCKGNNKRWFFYHGQRRFLYCFIQAEA